MASYSETLERNLNKIGSEDQVLEDIEEMEGENMEECNDNNVGGEAVSCPVCGKWIKKSFFAHLGKSKHCKKNISPEDLLKFENIRTLKRKMDNRTNIAKFRKVHPEKARKQTREGVGNFRKLNPEKARKQTREGVGKVRKLNPEKAKKQTREGFAKFRKVHPEKARKQAQEGMAKLRRVDGEEDRLYNFRVATLYGPIFSCISCHERKFHTNVQKFNDKIREKVERKIPLERCIDNLDLTSGPVMKGDDSPKKWICKTCLNSYLLKGKLPSHSVMNGLKIDMTSKERKENGLDLTEFEGSLVARNLMFQKIYLMPKSRWAGIKDKQILIPVSDDKIQNFLGQLPRTPTEAGLIAVNLKRKLEYKGSHKSQLIDPKKLFKFIATCKAAGHPLYQDVSTEEDFVEKCKKSKTDYMLVYGNEDNSSHVDSDDDSEQSSEGDDDDEDWETCEDDEDEDYDEEFEEDEEYDIYKDEKVSNYLEKLVKMLEEVNGTEFYGFRILDVSELNDASEDYSKMEMLKNKEKLMEMLKNKEKLWDRAYLKSSISLNRTLLDILDEFTEDENINRILDEAFSLMSVIYQQDLVGLWYLFFIEMHYQKAEVHPDYLPLESFENLEKEERKMRETFIERMGVDPVDPDKLFEIEPDSPEEEQLRWWPPGPFSKTWIHFEISEKFPKWCSLFTDEEVIMGPWIEDIFMAD